MLPEVKQDATARINRVVGQVAGIKKMIDEDRYCVDILTQISAATTALESLALQILDSHIRHCVAVVTVINYPDYCK